MKRRGPKSWGLSQQWIQPDSRGRIQLPPGFRENEWYLLEPQEEALILRPAKVEVTSRRKKEQAYEMSLDEFLENKFFPNLSDVFSQQESKWVSGVILYGSRARGDFLNTSDFDLACITSKKLSFKQRDRFMQFLQDKMQPLLQDLQIRFQQKAELSCVFVPKKSEQTSLIDLYFSIVEDGQVIWEEGQAATAWIKNTKSEMQKKSVSFEGQGKRRVWKWRAL